MRMLFLKNFRKFLLKARLITTRKYLVRLRDWEREVEDLREGIPIGVWAAV